MLLTATADTTDIVDVVDGITPSRATIPPKALKQVKPPRRTIWRKMKRQHRTLAPQATTNIAATTADMVRARAGAVEAPATMVRAHPMAKLARDNTAMGRILGLTTSTATVMTTTTVPASSGAMGAMEGADMDMDPDTVPTLVHTASQATTTTTLVHSVSGPVDMATITREAPVAAADTTADLLSAIRSTSYASSVQDLGSP